MEDQIKEMTVVKSSKHPTQLQDITVSLTAAQRKRILGCALDGNISIPRLSKQLDLPEDTVKEAIRVMRAQYDPFLQASRAISDVLISMAQRRAACEDLDEWLREAAEEGTPTDKSKCGNVITRLLQIAQRDDEIKVDMLQQAGLIRSAVETLQYGMSVDALVWLVNQVGDVISKHCTAAQKEKIRTDLRIIFERNGWQQILKKTDPMEEEYEPMSQEEAIRSMKTVPRKRKRNAKKRQKKA